MLFGKLSRRSLLVSSSVVALAACSRKEEPGVNATSSPSPEIGPGAMVSAMTDEELLGLVLMPHAYGHDAEDVTDASKAANQAHAGVDTPGEMVRKYHLGGLILMRFSAEDPTAGTNPTSNLDSPEQITKLTSGLQKAAGERLPLIIGIDQEFGAVTRITSGISALPAAMGFGAAADPGLTERAWRGVGGELMRLGINTDFAPTADVLANAGNTVIGSRSYGSDPAAVTAQITAVMAGLSGAGLASAVKHFPGHGNTDVDSHKGLPELDQPKSRLMDEDLVPFKAAIAAGVPMVMAGHLDVRSIDPGVPASLSKKVLVDLLRGELGFQGVCISDAFQMEPVTQRYGPREAAWRGILAGNDLILMPENVTEAYAGLAEALKDGRLPRERLVEAATRVVVMKQWLKAHASSGADLGSAAPVAAEIAHAAIAQVAGCGDTVKGPVRLTGGADVTRERLAKALKDRGVTVSADAPTTVQLTGFLDTPADVDPGAQVTVSTDTPYILAHVNSPIRLAAFGTTQFSMDAVADMLTGKTKATAHLPVPVKNLDAGC